MLEVGGQSRFADHRDPMTWFRRGPPGHPGECRCTYAKENSGEFGHCGLGVSTMVTQLERK
jgi:hypothetical protein